MISPPRRRRRELLMQKHAGDAARIAADRGTGGPRVLLGLFVICQLIFLFVNNFLSVLEQARGPNKKYIPAELQPLVEKILPDEKAGQDHFWTLLGTINRGADAWSDVTGQPQTWSLFSNPDGISDFPAVQLRWDEPAAAYPIVKANEPKILPSENEPADIDDYFRVGKFRLRRLESFVVADVPEKETLENTRAHWKMELADHVRHNHALILTYLRWRAGQRDSEQPRQVILLQRRYVARAPADNAPGHWQGPRVIPLARWQPGGKSDELEWYDPVAERFEAIRK
jgi:hypothetical protein